MREPNVVRQRVKNVQVRESPKDKRTNKTKKKSVKHSKTRCRCGRCHYEERTVKRPYRPVHLLSTNRTTVSKHEDRRDGIPAQKGNLLD